MELRSSQRVKCDGIEAGIFNTLVSVYDTAVRDLDKEFEELEVVI